MKTRPVRDLVVSGLLVAIGIALPTVFHAFGLGKTFLPMHTPVLIAGFVLRLPYAAVVGTVTPFISAVLTGMPPMFPAMPSMVFELATYAAAANILSRRFGLNVYFSLIGRDRKSTRLNSSH